MRGTVRPENDSWTTTQNGRPLWLVFAYWSRLRSPKTYHSRPRQKAVKAYGDCDPSRSSQSVQGVLSIVGASVQILYIFFLVCQIVKTFRVGIVSNRLEYSIKNESNAAVRIKRRPWVCQTRNSVQFYKTPETYSAFSVSRSLFGLRREKFL